ncbi:MAG TPA: NADH-quinone oxidoreductase subunit NuoH [Egibacteraceae bacterium]|nr:NADH-quinone oxidoreductase subunit NuoH [Egibacteraceae bacterium]
MDLVGVLIVAAVAVGAFALWLVGTALLIWAERRVVARMQSRLGPNRLGPFGLLQTLADGAKLFFKEDITPTNVDRAVYLAAPAMSAVVAMITFAVIPFGGSFEIGERVVRLQVWDPDIGLLWILAMSSIGVYGIVLAGWASGSKYPLLGGVRSTAQMISYELAMGLSLAAVFIWTGSLRSSDIVAAQSGTLFGPIPAWNIIPQILAFLLFFSAAVAETQRPPFDLPEAEGELGAGFHTEYSGAKFAMFFLAEFMNVITMSAVAVTLFLGGPAGPTFGLEGTIWGALLGVVYFAAKVALFLFVFVWLRGTLPRVRYERLMSLGWKVMLPLGLIWTLFTGVVVVLGQTQEQAVIRRYAFPAMAILLVVVLVLSLFGERRPAAADGDGGDPQGSPGAPGGGPSARALEAARASDKRAGAQVGG